MLDDLEALDSGMTCETKSIEMYKSNVTSKDSTSSSDDDGDGGGTSASIVILVLTLSLVLLLASVAVFRRGRKSQKEAVEKSIALSTLDLDEDKDMI